MNIAKVSSLDSAVFVGIDVHRASYAVTAVCKGVVAKRWRMAADPGELSLNLVSNFKGAKLLTAYEAGFSGFKLHRVLTKAGIENYVVNAGSIEISARDKVKTDRRDSHKIAIQLAAGRLKSIRIPTESEELSRELPRLRKQLVGNRVRIINQTRMKLHYYGLLPASYKGVLKKEFVLEVAKGQEWELRHSLESSCLLWSCADSEILTLDKKLREQAQKDHLEETYRSIPGVGRISSRILSTELGDMSQFPNERALFSYTGLTPMEFSSGNNRRLGSISKQGNSHIRGVLIECAWVALSKDKELRRAFERIASRAGKKRAIVAIARKLVGRARALFRKGVLYEVKVG